MACSASLIFVSLFLNQIPVFTARPLVSASRGVPVYYLAFAGTQYLYAQTGLIELMLNVKTLNDKALLSCNHLRETDGHLPYDITVLPATRHK